MGSGSVGEKIYVIFLGIQCKQLREIGSEYCEISLGSWQQVVGGYLENLCKFSRELEIGCESLLEKTTQLLGNFSWKLRSFLGEQ